MKKLFLLVFFLGTQGSAQTLSNGSRRIITCDVWTYSSEARTWGCRSIPREIIVAVPEKIDALEKEIQELKDLVNRLGNVKN
ncbi:MAG: hypothetical protein A4S09_06455 [Proteobacteria bacterium SG_bin7]|nr:MAG: hypothetical protein A4S09_06455 [Proteobacteria bacterium SG_bin7]